MSMAPIPRVITINFIENLLKRGHRMEFAMVTAITIINELYQYPSAKSGLMYSANMIAAILAKTIKIVVMAVFK